MDHWPLKFSHKAVLYSIIVSLGISVAFLRFFMPAGLLLVGFIVIGFFFYGLNYYSLSWRYLTIHDFEKRLVYYSMFFRFLFVLYMYLLTYIIDPNSFPFEIGAADSGTYHLAAIKLSNTPFSELTNVLQDLMKSKSDYGFPIYQSLIYKILGVHTFPVRLINCILGSFTVLYLSRIARYLFSEKHARLTGVIAMLFPSLLWFGAIQIKETLMIYLLVSVFYHAVKIYSARRAFFKSMLVIIFFSFFLFYFRTFLGVLVIMSILAFYFLSAIRKLNLRKIFSVLIIFFGSLFLINSSGIFQDISEVYQEGQNSDFFSLNLKSEAKRVGNISYKQAAVAPLIIIGSILTPFPSFLNTEPRQVSIITRFQNEMIRNLMYYFALLGLAYMIKKDFRKSSLLLLFILGYLYVITSAGNSFQDRFHLPMVPFFIIAMSVGLLQSDRKWLYNWNWYLAFIFIAQISWTIFKLNIRGI